MRRIVMLVMVALVMAAMMVAMAMPAFATKNTFGPDNCKEKGFQAGFTTFDSSDTNGNGELQFHDCRAKTPTE
jgi:hypothetical protein